jgi:HSP20 family protein
MKKQNIIIGLAGLTVSGLVLAASVGAQNFSGNNKPGDDTAALKQQVQRLNDRIEQLERQLGQRQKPSSPVVDEWDPFSEMDLMQRSMNRLFEDSFSRMPVSHMADFFNPRLDIKETPQQYLITMDIPGMDKENIDIKVQGHNLIVSGERSSEVNEDNPGKFARHERSFGHFMRGIPLPQDALTDQVDAQYANGVLTIKVGRSKGTNKQATGQKITVK